MDSLWSNHNECIDRNGSPKKRYFTYEQAEMTRISIEKDKNISLSVYKCNICNYYHLTKKI